MQPEDFEDAQRNYQPQRKLFTMLPPPSTKSSRAREDAGWKAMSSKSNKLKSEPKMKQAVTAAKKVWDKTSPEFKATVINKATDVVKNKMQNRPPNTSPNGPSGHSTGYALSKAPNPKQISLDTGIVPNTYTSDWLDAKENACSPLHMSSAVFQFPTYAASRLYDYFNQIIAFDLQSKAQANVGFNLNISTDFTAANILSAFNSLVYAIQIYNYYNSIISYHSDPSNKNEGMTYLRTQITANAIEGLTRLERRLADTPCPPELYNFLRYLSGNYFSGPNQGSPLLKINPGQATTTMTNVADIETAIAGLSTSQNNQIFSLLRRAVPQWRIGTLYDVEPLAVYDTNFLTIFANLPSKYYATGNNFVPTVAADDTTIAYNSFTNTLDGAAFAMTSIFNSITGQYAPGLIVVPTGSLGNPLGNTRKSFYEVTGVKGFYDVKTYPFLSRSRQETYMINDTATATISVHLSGTDRCQSVCINTITETAMNVVDYLMSWTTIKKEMQSGFNKSALNTKRRR